MFSFNHLVRVHATSPGSGVQASNIASSAFLSPNQPGELRGRPQRGRLSQVGIMHAVRGAERGRDPEAPGRKSSCSRPAPDTHYPEAPGRIKDGYAPTKPGELQGWSQRGRLSQVGIMHAVRGAERGRDPEAPGRIKEPYVPTRHKMTLDPNALSQRCQAKGKN